MATPDRLALALSSGTLTLPEEGGVVVLRARPSAFLEAVGNGRLACEQGFRPLHDALAAMGLPVGPRLPDPVRAAMVVVEITRSRAETLGNVARGLSMLPPGGVLAVNGAKTDGIDAVIRRLSREIPPADPFVKGHGRVVWAERPAELPQAVAAWAREAAPRENRDGCVTAPGMFSPEGADAGSRMLAQALDGRLRGRVADLGAGWGWLARAALERSPEISAIDLYEAEAAALEAARANVADRRASFHWRDVTELSRGDGGYDAVIANPPFHQGRAAEPDLGAAFIAAAGRILKPSGTLFVVANRQLPYEAPLEAAFGRWERVAEDPAFKVLVASRPRRG
jgi:16S rRNA (guanine1207-N2)-methyltransferase